MINVEDPDLRSAIGFVIRRITEEGLASGEPLDGDEQFLLANLPRHAMISEGVDADQPLAAPRDLRFEKLCSLAKSAHAEDLAHIPEAENDWEFAIAVLKLHDHPMLWLLQWGGIQGRKPWWDQWLLLAAALLVIVVGMAGMFFAFNGQSSRQVRWIIVLCGYVGLLLLIQISSQRIERWRLRQLVEKCRSSLSARLR